MKVIDIEATGKRINDLRLSHELSVRDMQMIFGFSTSQAIYHWIGGNRLPSIDNLVILADLFGCKMDDIIVVKDSEASRAFRT